MEERLINKRDIERRLSLTIHDGIFILIESHMSHRRACTLSVFAQSLLGVSPRYDSNLEHMLTAGYHVRYLFVAAKTGRGGSKKWSIHSSDVLRNWPHLSVLVPEWGKRWKND